jgi:hypothetical protein
MKKKFLKPITLVALAVLSNLTTNITASANENSEKKMNSIEQELIRIKNFRNGITKEQFMKPVDRVLLAEITPNIEGMTFAHRSHYSHSSHSSHRSHYSSSY